MAGAVLTALDEEPGDVLVFLPGAAEIRRVASRLTGAGLDAAVSVVPLYGDLSPEAQDAAIQPSPPGRRKVVLATSIAQTSLTIEGVRVVIDAGLSRVPRFSPRTGMARLATVRVSLASADQRRGRAGRLAPGVCYRLWAERLDPTLRPHDTPEILDTDLAPLALELADAGIADPAELRWLDPPPAGGARAGARAARELGALDAAGRITPHGRRMAGLGVHPRLAHMLIRGAELGVGADRVRSSPRVLARPRSAARCTRAGRRPSHPPRGAAPGRRAESPRPVLHRLRAEARLLGDGCRSAGDGQTGDVSAAGMLLALAYPDRDRAAAPGPGTAVPAPERAGRALRRPARRSARRSTWWPPELDGDARESRIFLAAPVTLDEVLRALWRPDRDRGRGRLGRGDRDGDRAASGAARRAGAPRRAGARSGPGGAPATR